MLQVRTVVDDAGKKVKRFLNPESVKLQNAAGTGKTNKPLECKPNLSTC